MRIAFVSSICVPFDAISAIVRSSLLWAAEAGHEVRLFTQRCDFADLPVTIAGSSTEVARDPFFRTADTVLLDFGICYDLFAVSLLAPADARVVVRFHNITPKELLPSWEHQVIERSITQMSLMRFVDEVLCDSETNLTELRRRGIHSRAVVRALPIDVPLAPPATKPSFDDGCLRIAFVGRFVRSKGPLELVHAAERALAEVVHDRVDITMVGNTAFSDQEYLTELRATARRVRHDSGGRLTVRLLGSVPNETRNDVLRDADLFVLPTYHEGFCVPIVEALASGCDVVAYDNSNVPAISAGLATLVPTGDTSTLAGAIAERAEAVSAEAWRAAGYAEHAAACAVHVRSFSPELMRDQFLADVASVA